MFDDAEYSSSATMASECFTGLNSISKKNKKSKNKKRFSDEQIRSLETMFETETKLEPRKKIQLARELGLQPRQVAIWFQNKRARWKSKQLERDYGMLRANYNTLASQFEGLKKEKQSLLVQVQKLNELAVEKSTEKSKIWRKETAENCTFDKLDNYADIKNESTDQLFKEPTSLSLQERSEHEIGVLSDNDISIKTEYFGLEDEEEEHDELLNVVESGDGSLASPENWESTTLDSNIIGLYDQSESGTSSSGYQWWDFWSS